MLDRIVSALRPFAFRGKKRLLGALIPWRGLRTARIFDCSMTLDLSESIQRNIYLGTFEPGETAFAANCLQPGMSFVDVGANVGYFTALAASRVGAQGRVFGIEPSPYAYAILERTVRENGLACVKTLPFGLGSAAGEAALYFGDDAGNHSPTMVPGIRGRPSPVPIRTLDECAAEWGLSRIDLMKIDIEGFEIECLKGARRLLRERRIRGLLIEFNDICLRKAGTSAQALYDLLIEAGFECVWGKPSFPRDCLLNLGFRQKEEMP